jgi:hypothetical protein
MLKNTILIRELHDSGTPISAANLLKFEAEIGHELPEAYRQFLLLRNGGRFYRHIVCPMEDTRWNSATGHFDFDMLDDPFVNGHAGDIRFTRRCSKGFIPERMLAIAEVAGGELMIDLHNGGVYVWAQDVLPDEDNTILAAPSFADFAQRLQYCDSNVEKKAPFTYIERFKNDKLKNYLAAGRPLNVRSAHGWTPLQAAGRYRNVDAIGMLLEAGEDINGVSEVNRHTVFELVVVGGCVDIVKLLLPYKPSLLRGDGSGRSLLDRKPEEFQIMPRIRALF